MGMGNEDMRLNGHFSQQLLGKHVYASACIKNDQIIVIGSDFNAGGIAAIFDGIGSGCWN
jgi:hypothetical protein